MTTTRLLRVLLLCPLFMLIVQFASAQKTITGKVSDEKGTPVAGASIVAKGTTIGTSTDASGSFSLNVPASTTRLVVSYVGYTNQEVDISSTTNITITLSAQSTSLTD